MPPNPSQQDRAKAYARARRTVGLLGWAAGAAYVVLWLVAGWGPTVRATVATYTAAPWILVAGCGLTFALPFEMLSFPLALYGGFVLPHRYGQSRQTFAQWCADLGKGWAVGGLLGLVLLEGLYAILRWQPAWWWLWATAGVLVFNVLLTQFAPVVIFPLFFRFSELDNAELRGRLVSLCDRAHTRVRGVFTFDLGRKTRAANAALAGLGHTRRILLSDTLCANYTPAEIEVVLAHELGHHVRHHLPKGIAASTAGTLILFAATHALVRPWLPNVGAWGIADIAALPLLALVLGALTTLTRPIGNILSRRFEREADASALTLATEPAAMISTMQKLADHNLVDREPHPLVVWYAYSHPPINERIAVATAHVTGAGTGDRGEPVY